MSDKGKRFPLSLSSVVDQSAKREGQSPSKIVKRVATPQTATQNAAQHLKRTTTSTFESGARTTQAVPNERPTPLVSDAVRHAMVTRIAKAGVRDTKVLAAMQAVP
ncbi:MAG TPA: protein-L-isoaspartate O-methyltransferase, partial [Burkholderiaceae bacterium]|nr:protein-L-isoaspartate O-methyltransferase [Burkholderiaceae bacterium]